MDKKPKLLITGINGLIGKLIRNQLSSSFDIYGLDIKPPFSDRVLNVDISYFKQIIDNLQNITPLEYIIHLAADSSSTATWISVLEANIKGTRNVFEAARQKNVKRVIFASSNHVTGAYEGFSPRLNLHLQNEPEKITISHPIRPDGNYGVSKAFGEALARYYSACWGIEFVCLRIGTVSEDNNPRSDERVMKTWLSHRDLIQLINKSLTANVTFGIYYGVSDNKSAFWDITNAREDLGYFPEDDASKLEQKELNITK